MSISRWKFSLKIPPSEQKSAESLPPSFIQVNDIMCLPLPTFFCLQWIFFKLMCKKKIVVIFFRRKPRKLTTVILNVYFAFRRIFCGKQKKMRMKGIFMVKLRAVKGCAVVHTKSKKRRRREEEFVWMQVSSDSTAQVYDLAATRALCLPGPWKPDDDYIFLLYKIGR